MPDITLHPEGQRRADAVIAEPVMTEYQARCQAGWMQPIDWVFIWMIIGALVTVMFWRIFATPSAINLIACLLVILFIFQIWLVLLTLRCALFVLKLRAAMELLPQEAARIVMGLYSGKPLTLPK